MIIVTGGAGFIGSNIVKLLNHDGIDDIWVVDDLTVGSKVNNLAKLRIQDYSDKDDFLNYLLKDALPKEQITAIIHQGACSDTMEWDGKFMLKNNYEYSKNLLDYCIKYNIPFIYASSAAVYGNGTLGFKELADCEYPLNIYAYSKLLFDQYVRRILPATSIPIVGLRYFNVYGQGEGHKGKMASIAWHAYQQLNNEGVVALFCGVDGYNDGEQLRDFVYVADVANVNLWFLKNPARGIFNVGTGSSYTFNELVQAMIGVLGYGTIKYIPFPDKLRAHYQNYTKADITALRDAGYSASFANIKEGVAAYCLELASY